MRNFTHRWPPSGHFVPKLCNKICIQKHLTFFQFPKKRRGDLLPLPPSSYAPDIMKQDIAKYFLKFIQRWHQWWLIFQIITVVVSKTTFLWPLKGESTLQKQPPRGVIQICVWQILSKSFKRVCEGVKF